jgi:hypothetical protein
VPPRKKKQATKQEDTRKQAVLSPESGNTSVFLRGNISGCLYQQRNSSFCNKLLHHRSSEKWKPGTKWRARLRLKGRDEPQQPREVF